MMKENEVEDTNVLSNFIPVEMEHRKERKRVEGVERLL